MKPTKKNNNSNKKNNNNDNSISSSNNNNNTTKATTAVFIPWHPDALLLNPNKTLVTMATCVRLDDQNARYGSGRQTYGLHRVCFYWFTDKISLRFESKYNNIDTRCNSKERYTGT
ncbi:hypothetical protein ElyMa_003259300 [Elysia marginata]|uniref:Uncharacterized protein n=1 Tax=Elysia marginata TaxID=1093978 RepID=A0AAV4J9V6_9GAST|nr:hypothetical protein ElyMa_003259300 [Elysia marginata]